MRKAYKQLQALVFFPRKDVIEIFKYISQTAPVSFKVILDYFEEYYIGVLVDPSRKNATKRLVPLFPISMWNCYDRVMNDLPRTNNPLESWHKLFETDVKKYSTVNNLVEQFRVEQHLTETYYVQLTSGDYYKRNRKNVERDERIKLILSEYKKENFVITLDNLSKLL